MWFVGHEAQCHESWKTENQNNCTCTACYTVWQEKLVYQRVTTVNELANELDLSFQIKLSQLNVYSMKCNYKEITLLNHKKLKRVKNPTYVYIVLSYKPETARL